MRKHGSLQVQILFDYFRGTRPTRTAAQHAGRSIDMLRPLMHAYPDRVQVGLYRTPNMNRFLARVMPPRWNETVGVQHAKVAVFDDSVLLTG